MKILIIEPKGSKYKSGGVSKFEVLIKQELLRQQNLMDTETEFVIRDMTDIEDLLYEQSTSHLKKDSAMFFDTIDIIFINGESKILPWGKRTENINVLLRMCMKTNKMVFANGLGFYCLMMLCATDNEKGYFNVINGNGYGGKLSEITNEIRLQKIIEENDVFLDSLTGDFYRYNYENKEWIPKGNMGVHKRIFTHDSEGQLDKFLMTTTTYKAKVHDNDQLYVTHKDEAVIYLRKSYIHHWAVQGCANKFLVMNDCPFEAHPFNFRNPAKTFEILAETATSPQIVSMSGGAIIATGFLMNKNYPDTLITLRNFIKQKLIQVRDGGSRSLSISVADNTWYSKENADTKKMYASETFRHCGMTTVCRGFQIVDNNSILKQSHRANVVDQSKRGKMRHDLSPSGGKRTRDGSPARLSDGALSFSRATSKNFNTEYKKLLVSQQNWKKTPKKKELDAEYSAVNDPNERMPAFRFKHPGVMKKKLYGNIKLLRSEGFDFDDGWAPGYRTAASRINPLQTEQEEPSLIADKSKYARDMLMDRKPADIIAGLQKPTPTNQYVKKTTLQRDETLTGSDTATNSPEKQTPSLQDIRPTKLAPMTISKTSLLVLRGDPNEFDQKQVVRRRVGSEYFSRFKIFNAREKELKEKGFFFGQPYVTPQQQFR